MSIFKNGVGRPSNETLKKRRLFYVALVGMLGLTVAFASLSTTLTINGQAKMNKSSWDIHFDNLELVEEKGRGVGNTVGNGTDDAKIEESGIEINNLNAELSEPNDSVVYTVDIVNEGEIDAVVHINEYFENTLPNKLEVTALYSDSTSITSEEKELNAGETLPVTITIKYKDITSASDLVSEDTIVNIKYILVAEQKTGEVTFDTDSFEEEELNIGDGEEDKISGGLLGDYQVIGMDGFKVRLTETNATIISGETTVYDSTYSFDEDKGILTANWNDDEKDVKYIHLSNNDILLGVFKQIATKNGMNGFENHGLSGTYSDGESFYTFESGTSNIVKNGEEEGFCYKIGDKYYCRYGTSEIFEMTILGNQITIDGTTYTKQ